MIQPVFSSDDPSGRSWLAVESEGFLTVRWLGVLLIALQAVILGYLSGARLFPAMVIVLACGIGMTRYRLHLDRIVLQLLCAVIVMGFVLYFMIAPFPLPDESQFVRTPWAHTIARCLICLQLLALVVQHESGHPPIWLAGLGAMSLPFAANIQLSGESHGPLVFWIVAFVAVAALYCSQARRRVTTASRSYQVMRSVLMLMALIVAMSLGGGSAVAILKYERNIEWLLRDYLGQGAGSVRTGFSPTGRLNDVLAWKTLDADHVTLRVFADHEPGYLRGKAFDIYHLPEWDHSWKTWSTSGEMQPLRPANSVRGLPAQRRAGEELFELDPAANGPWSTLEIWPETHMREYLFAPWEAGYLAIHSQHVMRDPHGNLMCEVRDESLPYSIFRPDSPPRFVLDADLRDELTSVDPGIDPYLHELAESLFADCRTARDKMNRIQSWFRNNFGYQLGIRIPRRADPLTYFLRERKSAHCEFFATGTAVLLRIAGVPCRYVTGYVAAEENAVGGYWVARNKDAHAWVEAYDDASRQWVIVESTPSAGVPTHRGTTIPSQVADSFQQRWAMLLLALRSVGVGGLMTQAAHLVWSIPGLVILLLIAGGLLAWKSPSLPVFRFHKSDRRLKAFHDVLKRLDRQAKQHGLRRNTDETLLQFADRIRHSETPAQWRQELAACYNRYAQIRFRGPAEPESLANLLQTASTFRRHRT